MKCEMPGCQRMLKPDDTYETDKAPDAKHKPKYRWVCGKCYRRVNGEATDRVEQSAEGMTSEALQMALAL